MEVSGMLLYAKTSESIRIDSDYVGGNKISVKLLRPESGILSEKRAIRFHC